MLNYWTETHNDAIKAYYHAANEQDRSRIIDTKLAGVLYELARRALTSFNLHPTAEDQQDIVIHLVYKAMPRLAEDKLTGALGYLWTAARNYILTYIYKRKNSVWVDINTLIQPSPKESADEQVEDMNIYCSEDYVRRMYLTEETAPNCDEIDLDKEADLCRTRQRILSELDTKIRGQHIVNCTNSVFLLLLKDYILANDYEVRGFGAYVMEAMHLKLSTYRAIAGRLGLRTKDFNEKK